MSEAFKLAVRENMRMIIITKVFEVADLKSEGPIPAENKINSMFSLWAMNFPCKDGERDVDSNMVTLKKASHYTTSDLPTIINGSWIKTVVSCGMLT